MGILQGVKTTDLKSLDIKALKSLSEKIRKEIISATEKNGGHLSSNLGIVETTVALYRVFDFPKDKLIFDVGHQCYAHKILSGRSERFSTIRTDGGLSGFPDCKESEFDQFTTGHAGTSVASGLGLCTARDSENKNYFVIAVVGDGSLVNGLNLEAITANNVKPKKFIVILNDNGMSISSNKNGLYKLISKQTTKKGYVKGKSAVKKIFGNSFITAFFRGTRDLFKRVLNKENYFERFGFKYVGVVDGNDLKETVKILERVKNVAENRAVFLHLKTTKGKGFKEAEERADAYHGVGKNHTFGVSGVNTLGNILTELSKSDDKIVAVTAGMKDGTGLTSFEKAYPGKVFDVGIAEEYAVTYAAGMAKGGLKPIVAVYSTFMQRAYDQIIHDVCLQNLPVIFCLDRAGFSGEDGKTHQGLFDLSYTLHIPNLTVLAPTTSGELKGAVKYALTLNSPVCIRYSKELGTDNTEDFNDKLNIVKDGSDLTVLTVGKKAQDVAMRFSSEYGKSVKVISARVLKPLDEKTLSKIETPIIVIEENLISGGFGSSVAQFFAENSPKKIAFIGVKDKFVEHGSAKKQAEDNGFTVENIIEIADKLFD